MDSDSDDDFQPLKAKRITTDKGNFIIAVRSKSVYDYEY